ncbi:MAG: FAD-dependent oxidoreductase [Muribaculaceae bacterium]|nr:FAD-dependent oxidoreductase [Muribaculaceae bacterium]
MDLIIGAGVTGLSYANFTQNKCLVVEGSESPGGYCKTLKRNGFVWDYSGHFFHFRYPELEAFVCKNIPEEDLAHVQKHTQILYNGKYIDFPFQKNIHQLDKQEFIDCLYDLFNTNSSDNVSTFKEMLYAKLGRSIAEKFLIPYNEKLYACDLNRLDMEAMGRFFPKATPEEIIKNFKDGDNRSYNSYFTYPKGGAIQYIDSILQNINCEILYNTFISKIDIQNKIAYSANGQEFKYDNLISTMPFPQLLDVTGLDYDKTLFTCNKVLVFNLGFDKKGFDKKNSWIYIPSKDFVFYRIGYYDNILSTDRLSLYIEIGMAENAPLPDERGLLSKVIEDLIKAGIIDDTYELVDYQTILMNPAYVHVNKLSAQAVEKYKSQLEKDNIYSIGRYGSWIYCSIEDNILEAKELAGRVSKV